MGSLVHEAQNAGWNAYGYELHVTQAEAANAYWNTDRILSYDFDKFRHEYSNYFDVINNRNDVNGNGKQLEIDGVKQVLNGQSKDFYLEYKIFFCLL